MKRKKDILLLAALLAAALLLLGYGLVTRGGAAAQPSPTPADGAGEEPADEYSAFVRESVRAYLDEYPAEAYLLIDLNGSVYSPIPLNGENALRIAQQDGSENVIHIGKNAFCMESSNCEGQNCVQQGEVTLENRDSRLLFNLVICLPHNLSLELLTRAEAEARLLEMYAQQPPDAVPEG